MSDKGPTNARPIVVMDTNAIFSEKRRWSVPRSLTARAEEGAIDLVLPEAVVLERKRQYRDAVDKAHEDVGTKLRGLAKLEDPNAAKLLSEGWPPDSATV